MEGDGKPTYDCYDEYAWTDMRDAFTSGMRAQRDLDAAREPQPAPGRTDEFARVKVRLCALVDSLDKSVDLGRHGEEFDQGAAHASAVTARQLREILDDTALGRTPQPAPGESSPLGLRHAVTSNRLGHALAALREIRDATGTSDVGHDTAHKALDNDAAIRGNVELTREPQAAPELRDAMAEAGKLRDLLDQVTTAVTGKRWALTAAEKRVIAGYRAQAGLPPKTITEPQESNREKKK
ncbi:MAG: hypothetical protein ACRDVE_14490 [Actinocrinis sp.]